MKEINTYKVGEFTTSVYWTSLSEIREDDKIVLVCDENTLSYAKTIGDFPMVVLQPGEEFKQWDAVSDILKNAMDNGLDRQSRIIGIGGGVVTDLAAFAASIYMRGCSLSLVATSLLAMVDAAFGGKTGMDFLSYKNSVGTFYPAQRLYLDISVLDSLPFPELQNGMAEIIKTALLGDHELLVLLEQNHSLFIKRNRDFLTECVERCIRVKGRIVQEDLKEKGLRAVLNLGHTFGHALETISHFDVSHGSAVAWGIRKALSLSVKLDLCPILFAKRVNQLLDLYGYDLQPDLGDKKAYFAAMDKDKKKSDNKLRFVLMKDLEEPVVMPVDLNLVKEIL